VRSLALTRGSTLASLLIVQATLRLYRPGDLRPEMLAQLRANGVRVLGSQEVLGSLRERTAFHRAHGERHVIGPTHAALTRAAAGEIVRVMPSLRL